MNKKTLIGRTIHDLFIEDEAGLNEDGEISWVCKCVCGNTVTLPDTLLRSQTIENCGCQLPVKQSKPATPNSVKGVRYQKDTGKWQATISTQKRYYALGLFEDKATAELRRREAETRVSDGTFVDWFYSQPISRPKTCRTCEHYLFSHFHWAGKGHMCRHPKTNGTTSCFYQTDTPCQYWERIRHEGDSYYKKGSSISEYKGLIKKKKG